MILLFRNQSTHKRRKVRNFSSAQYEHKRRVQQCFQCGHNPLPEGSNDTVNVPCHCHQQNINYYSIKRRCSLVTTLLNDYWDKINGLSLTPRTQSETKTIK
uniref:Uncharacterized protein n=1 Tax=Cacopsylla melanoneura TaxID=428564 RepID=A0A8D8VTW8_9HEMI